MPTGVTHRLFDATSLEPRLVIDFIMKNYDRIGRYVMQITTRIVC